VGDLDRTRAVTASSAGVSAVDQVRKSDTFHDRDLPSRGCNSALPDADGPPGFLWSGSGRGSPIGCVRSTGLGRVRVESVHLRGGGSRLWIPAWDCWVPITESFRNSGNCGLRADQVLSSRKRTRPPGAQARFFEKRPMAAMPILPGAARLRRIETQLLTGLDSTGA
jgi:hypothetical protein